MADFGVECDRCGSVVTNASASSGPERVTSRNDFAREDQHAYENHQGRRVSSVKSNNGTNAKSNTLINPRPSESSSLYSSAGHGLVDDENDSERRRMDPYQVDHGEAPRCLPRVFSDHHHLVGTSVPKGVS